MYLNDLSHPLVLRLNKLAKLPENVPPLGVDTDLCQPVSIKTRMVFSGNGPTYTPRLHLVSYVFFVESGEFKSLEDKAAKYHCEKDVELRKSGLICINPKHFVAKSQVFLFSSPFDLSLQWPAKYKEKKPHSPSSNEETISQPGEEKKRSQPEPPAEEEGPSKKLKKVSEMRLSRDIFEHVCKTLSEDRFPSDITEEEWLSIYGQEDGFFDIIMEIRHWALRRRGITPLFQPPSAKRQPPSAPPAVAPSSFSPEQSPQPALEQNRQATLEQSPQPALQQNRQATLEQSPQPALQQNRQAQLGPPQPAHPQPAREQSPLAGPPQPAAEQSQPSPELPKKSALVTALSKKDDEYPQWKGFPIKIRATDGISRPLPKTITLTLFPDRSSFPTQRKGRQKRSFKWMQQTQAGDQMRGGTPYTVDLDYPWITSDRRSRLIPYYWLNGLDEPPTPVHQLIREGQVLLPFATPLYAWIAKVSYLVIGADEKDDEL